MDKIAIKIVDIENLKEEKHTQNMFFPFLVNIYAI
jgi:hypothetical protein